jgi:hypothetical protein
MTDNPVRSLRFASGAAAPQCRCITPCQFTAWRVTAWRVTATVGAVIVVLAIGGCAERKRPALPWATAALVHPRIPAARVSEEVTGEEPAELRLVLPEPAQDSLGYASARPARPRVATTQPAAAETRKPQTPFVAPQLSAAESSTAQQETAASLAAAENDIAAASGKSLNAAQADMSSKINGFMADARAAGAAGDWTSAQTLARKAQLLAQELVESLH